MKWLTLTDGVEHINILSDTCPDQDQNGHNMPFLLHFGLKDDMIALNIIFTVKAIIFYLVTPISPSLKEWSVLQKQSGNQTTKNWHNGAKICCCYSYRIMNSTQLNQYFSNTASNTDWNHHKADKHPFCFGGLHHNRQNQLATSYVAPNVQTDKLYEHIAVMALRI